MKRFMQVWRERSRRQKIVAVIVGSVAVLWVAGTVMEEDTKTASVAAATPAVSTSASVTPASNSSDISDWATSAADWSTGLSDAMNTISIKLGENGFITLLLMGDTDAQIALAMPLLKLESCTADLPTPPSNPRARDVQETLREACWEFEQGASKMTRGVDNLDTALLTEAANHIAAGGRKMTTATAQTQALIG